MRSVPLPESVDPDRAKASFEGGTLEVVIPKVSLTMPKKVAIAARKEAAATKGGTKKARKGGEAAAR
jgi:hypothetical protein